MKLNTGGRTAEEMENEGQLRAAGFFKAIVEDAGPDPKKPETAMRYVFCVTEGAYKGAKVTQWIDFPSTAQDEAAENRLTSRFGAFAQRLGLCDGVSADPEIDWDECISNDVVIEVEYREYKDREGKLKTGYQLAYIGVYPLDHVKIPAKVREELRLPAAKPAKVVAKTASNGHANGHTVTKPTVTAKKVNLADL